MSKDIPATAWSELVSEMQEGERVEAIVFGAWGWGSAPGDGNAWELGYGEPEPPPVPFEKRGIILTADEARPMMQTWVFSGGYGAPACYAVRVWTNKRIMWVTQYDGSTGLDSTERNPIAHIPDMPGG